VPLQAAADTFNNPHAERAHATFFEIQPQTTTTPHTRTVNVTRQVDVQRAE